MLSAVLLLLSQAQLQGLINSHLDELLEALVRLDLELDVLLFRADEATRRQLLLIQLKLLLEGRQLVNHLLLRVAQFTNDLIRAMLLLLKSEFEILALRLQNLTELLLFHA